MGNSVKNIAKFLLIGLLTWSCSMKSAIDQISEEAPGSSLIQRKVQFDVSSATMVEGSFAIMNVVLDQIYTTDTSVSLFLPDPSSRFQSLPLTLVIPAGSLSAPLTLQANEDSIYQGPQSFVLSLSALGSGVGLGANQVLNITLNDNDPVPALSINDVAANESTGTLQFTVSQDRVSLFPSSFDWATADVTALAGSDYTTSSGSSAIPAGAVSATISIAINNDSLYEASETFLANLSNCVTCSILDSQGIGTITNDDALPTVQFSVAASSASEAAGSINVTVTQSAASAFPTTIPFTVNGASTASGAGVDYQFLPVSPLTIPAGSTSVDLTVTIIDDLIFENGETAIFDLGAPTNAALAAVTSHTLTINENDPLPLVDFSLASQSVSEAAGTATITVNLSLASSQTVTVPFSVNGTSTASGGGVDYSFSPPSPLSFAPGITSQTITVTLNEDVLNEDDEMVTFDLGAPTNAAVGTVTSHQLTLLDNDVQPSVQFTSASQSNAESITSVTVTAQLSVVSGRNVTVPFSIGAGSTATGGGVDYSFSPASPLVINAGATTASLTFTVIDDAAAESNETVIVDMGVPTNASVGAMISHTITILDNDAPVTLVVTSTKATSNASFSYVDLDVDWSRNLAYAASRKGNICIEAINFSNPNAVAVEATIGSASLQVCLGVQLFDNNTKVLLSSNGSSKLAAWDLTATPTNYGSWYSMGEYALGHNGKRISKIETVGANQWTVFSATRWNGRKLDLSVAGAVATLTPLNTYAPGGIEFNAGTVLGNKYLIQSFTGAVEPVRFLNKTDMTLTSTDQTSFYNWSAVTNASDTVSYVAGDGGGTFYKYSGGVVSRVREYSIPGCMVRGSAAAQQGANDYIYSLCTNGTLDVFDVTDINNPVRVYTGTVAGSFEGEAYQLKIKPNSSTGIIVSNRGDFIILNLNGLSATSTQYSTVNYSM